MERQYCIMAGPTRTGTTSLFRFLSGDNRVCLSIKKETNFFLDAISGINAFTLQKYRELFPDVVACKMMVEASPLYFMAGKAVAQAISVTVPDVKIVITLRDPVDRFISLYKHIQTKRSVADQNQKNVSFEDFFSACLDFDPADFKSTSQLNEMSFHEGCYADLLSEWISVFGADRIKVVYYEDLAGSRRQQELDGLLDWLGLDDSELRDREFLHENKSRAVKNDFLHGFAMKLNDFAEPILTGNHFVRDALRNVYYWLNGGSKKDIDTFSLSGEQRNMVAKAYAERNRNLRGILEGLGVDHFPEWVTVSSS